jgi:hypothetical protein
MADLHSRRGEYRRVYNEVVDDQHALRRDRYAKFMATRYDEVRERRAKKWAERFASGRHWHKLDGEGTRILLHVLTQEADRTGREVRPEDIFAVSTALELGDEPQYGKQTELREEAGGA